MLVLPPTSSLLALAAPLFAVSSQVVMGRSLAKAILLLLGASVAVSRAAPFDMECLKIFSSSLVSALLRLMRFDLRIELVRLDN